MGYGNLHMIISKHAGFLLLPINEHIQHVDGRVYQNLNITIEKV
jgi:hypothetical protein